MAAAATGAPKPEMASLRRARPRDVLLMALVLFAAYLLVSQLAAIGFGTIADELGNADPAWVIVALILAQCTFIGSGIAVSGAVATPLAILPCIVLQSAIKFINLTVPSSAGRIGMNLRFLQRMGAPPGEALAAGAVDDVSETMVQAILLLLAIPLVGVDIDTSQFQGAGPDRRLLIGIAVAAVIGVVIAIAVPKVRARVVASDSDCPLGTLERGQDPAQARRAVRRQHHVRAAVCGRPRGYVPRIRIPPQPRAADLHQHLGLRPLQRHSGARRHWCRRGQPCPPASSRWASTNRPHSRSPSPNASPRSTFRRSGATRPCGG